MKIVRLPIRYFYFSSDTILHIQQQSGQHLTRLPGFVSFSDTVVIAKETVNIK